MKLWVVLPGHKSDKLQIMVSPQEQVHEVRQSIIDLPSAFQYTCFHLEYQGKKINDFIPIAEIPELEAEAEYDNTRTQNKHRRTGRVRVNIIMALEI